MRTSFTVDDANKMLPLVRRIVSDVVRDYMRWQDKVKQFEAAAANRTIDTPEGDADRLEREAQDIARDIDGYIAEISKLGVQMKGLDTGLVDFPGELNGRPVLLCWQLGEEKVEHWHEENAGYIGRQPLPKSHGES